MTLNTSQNDVRHWSPAKVKLLLYIKKYFYLDFLCRNISREDAILYSLYLHSGERDPLKNMSEMQERKRQRENLLLYRIILGRLLGYTELFSGVQCTRAG